MRLEHHASGAAEIAALQRRGELRRAAVLRDDVRGAAEGFLVHRVAGVREGTFVDVAQRTNVRRRTAHRGHRPLARRTALVVGARRK